MFFQTKWHQWALCQGEVRASPLVRMASCAQRREGLPWWFQSSPTAMRYLQLLAPLAWGDFPERPLSHPAHQRVLPWATFGGARAGAVFVKRKEDRID
ncbi:MAG: hypothetical protein GXP42_13005 [Chloroflexi bacterium]|nr:hypothetical protein [Chloroflexota bacterium]